VSARFDKIKLTEIAARKSAKLPFPKFLRSVPSGTLQISNLSIQDPSPLPAWTDGFEGLIAFVWHHHLYKRQRLL
jgi:hypothetical protein